MELFERIKTLNAAHGPSGDEGEVREAIARLAAPFLWTIRLPRVSVVTTSA